MCIRDRFFASGPLALGTIICISIWKNFPFVSLMLLAALQSVAKDYYDAASIDGASGFIQFKKITWPDVYKRQVLQCILQRKMNRLF